MKHGIQYSTVVQARLRLERERRRAEVDRDDFLVQANRAWLSGSMLSTKMLAEFLAVPFATVKWWRHSGGGPPFVRLGTRTVRYFRDDILAWLRSQTVDVAQKIGSHRGR